MNKDTLINEAVKCNIYRKEHDSDLGLCLDEIIKHHKKGKNNDDYLKLLKEILKLARTANLYKSHENEKLTEENNQLKEKIKSVELAYNNYLSDATRYRWLKKSREHLICVFQIETTSWDKIIDNQLVEIPTRQNRK